MADKNYEFHYQANNKNLFRFILMACSVVTIIEIVNYFLYQETHTNSDELSFYLKFCLLLPVFFYLLLCICTGLFVKYLNLQHPRLLAYLLTISVVMLANMIVVVHHGIHIVYSIYIIPIFISLLYANRRITIALVVSSVILYSIVFFLYLPILPPSFYNHNMLDFTSNLGMIFCSGIVVILILKVFDHYVDTIVAIRMEQSILQDAVKRDALTGLYNHVTFFERLSAALKNHVGEMFVLVLDIDNFKGVNDRFGHAFGDQVILALTRIIQDSLGNDDTAFRYGGEEFAILSMRDYEEVYQFAERIRRAFCEVRLEPYWDEGFSVSIGIGRYDPEEDDEVLLFNKADSALYRAKELGKNRIVRGKEIKKPSKH